MLLARLKSSEETFVSAAIFSNNVSFLAWSFYLFSSFVEAKFINKKLVKCANLLNDPFHARKIDLSLLELKRIFRHQRKNSTEW